MATACRSRRRAPAEAAEPYALQLAGRPTEAAEVWRKLGCPYDAALALADADDERSLRRALEKLRRLDARPAAAIVAAACASVGHAGYPEDRIGPPARIRPGSPSASAKCSHSSPQD